MKRRVSVRAARCRASDTTSCKRSVRQQDTSWSRNTDKFPVPTTCLPLFFLSQHAATKRDGPFEDVLLTMLHTIFLALWIFPFDLRSVSGHHTKQRWDRCQRERESWCYAFHRACVCARALVCDGVFCHLICRCGLLLPNWQAERKQESKKAAPFFWNHHAPPPAQQAT